MTKQHKGFTVIELVMVIVILGILTGLALPRFLDLRSEARKARVDSVSGALRAATAIAHAAWLVDGGKAARISAEGIPVALVNGYPAASGGGIVALVARLIEGDDDLVTRIGAGKVAIDVAGGTPGACGVTYAEAGSVNAPPAIAVDKHGC